VGTKVTQDRVALIHACGKKNVFTVSERKFCALTPAPSLKGSIDLESRFSIPAKFYDIRHFKLVSNFSFDL